MARPRKHSSGAARTAAHRAANPTLVVIVTPRIADSVESIAGQFDVSKAVVIRSLLRFALTNRDWKRQGLIHLDNTEPTSREQLLSAFSALRSDGSPDELTLELF